VGRASAPARRSAQAGKPVLPEELFRTGRPLDIILAAGFFPVWEDQRKKTATAWKTVRPGIHLYGTRIRGTVGSKANQAHGDGKRTVPQLHLSAGLIVAICLYLDPAKQVSRPKRLSSFRENKIHPLLVLSR
jgi:hypothetical protein